MSKKTIEVTELYEEFEDYDPPIQLGPIKPIRSIYEHINFEDFIEGDTLNCRGKKISIELLGNFMRLHPEITNLNISNCHIDIYKLDKLTHHYGSILRNIELLDLSSNPIKSPGLRQFILYCCSTEDVVKKITSLNFSSCGINDYGYKCFLNHAENIFPNLCEVDFSKNKIDIIPYTLQISSNKLMLQLKLFDLTDNPCEESDLYTLQKIMVYNGYQCKLNRTITDQDLESIFKNMCPDYDQNNTVDHRLLVTELTGDSIEGVDKE